MRQDTFISNLDDLKNWFDLNQTGKEVRPYFTLWRGFESKADRIICRNVEVTDGEKAWELLEEMITAHSDGGGSFRVYLTDKPLHNFGLTTLVKLPGTNPAAGANAGIQGIYGDPDKRIQDEVERRIEMYELKRQIEDLQAAKGSAISGMDQFREVLTEFPELRQLGYVLGLKLMGMQGAGAQPIAQPTTPSVAGNNAPDNNTEGYDYDVLEPALDKLRSALGAEPEKVISSLADFAEKNPQIVRDLLQSLPNS